MQVSKMPQNAHCFCRRLSVIRTAKSDEYDAFKKLLASGKHPAFIGRNMYKSNARNGGAIFVEFEKKVIAVALVNPRRSVLSVLNIHPHHRGHGIGRMLVDYLSCNFARVIDSSTEFFEKCGYKKLGEPFQGRSFKTWVMVRISLLDLQEKIRRVHGKLVV